MKNKVDKTIELKNNINNPFGPNQFDYLSLYKIYLDSIEKVSDRRSQTNRFYILLHSGLLAIISTVITIISSKELNEAVLPADKLFILIKVIILAVSILSIFFCILWFITIISYKQLNGGKFRVLFKIEEKIPFRCFKDEWEVELGKGDGYNINSITISSEKEIPVKGENEIFIGQIKETNKYYIRIFNLHGEIWKNKNEQDLFSISINPSNEIEIYSLINKNDSEISKEEKDRIIEYIALKTVNTDIKNIDKKDKKYTEFTKVEMILPFLIGIIYIVITGFVICLFY